MAAGLLSPGPAVAGAGETDDGTLVRRSLMGDRAGFTGLMARYKAPIHRYIRRYVRPEEDAYDLLQETFVAAWRALDRYDPGRPMEIWLRRIALNKCRDHGRRTAVRRAFSFLLEDAPGEAAGIAAPGVPEDEAMIAREGAARLQAAIQALPGGLRDPLVLTALEGLSQAQAGAVLGLTAKAVEVRVYRARLRLAKAVETESHGAT